MSREIGAMSTSHAHQRAPDKHTDGQRDHSRMSHVFLTGGQREEARTGDGADGQKKGAKNCHVTGGESQRKEATNSDVTEADDQRKEVRSNGDVTGVHLQKEVVTNDKATSAADEHPWNVLRRLAGNLGVEVGDKAFAIHMDANDPVRHLREEFHYPKMKDLIGTDLSVVDPEDDCIYFCGNSLGLMPRGTRRYMDGELDKWSKLGVQGHRNGLLPWAFCDTVLDGDMAKLVGAQKGEVALMNGLTVNLHLLLISFYRPTQKRHKILCESKAFPSDHYAFESQIHLHGFDPASSLLCLEPREGQSALELEDILHVIEEQGDSIAVVCFSGVQYYSGQLFDIPTITKAGQAKGCYVGWDMAHAAGNVELHLHDWGVDFACWCTYKYMCSGAGSLAGFFLHDKHSGNDFPKLQGWWGHDISSRFDMDNQMKLTPGAYGYRISNPPGLLCPAILAYLEVMKKTSMRELRKKSCLLTGYLELLIAETYGPGRHPDVIITSLTPTHPAQRGAQLSLSFNLDIHGIFEEFIRRGIVCDKRLPHVIRLAPVPLYCSFQDAYRFMQLLQESVQAAHLTSKT